MAIRYKVVSIRPFDGERVSFCAKNKYQIIYKKGRICSALEGSLGIFTFKTYEQAYKFLIARIFDTKNRLILKVRPIGRGKTPKNVGCSSSLQYFYDNKHKTGFNIPEGTVCYKSVEVLE